MCSPSREAIKKVSNVLKQREVSLKSLSLFKESLIKELTKETNVYLEKEQELEECQQTLMEFY